MFTPANYSISFTGQRDVNSRKFDLYYEGAEIGYGHINDVSNMAHLTFNDGNDEHENYELEICELIEVRKIDINS